MDSRLITVIATAVVLIITFIGISFAYSSSTESSGNDMSLDYVELEQTHYSFSSYDVSFNTAHTEIGTVYMINDVTAQFQPTAQVLSYYGVLVGEDTLTATISGRDSGTIDITVKTFQGGFRDFSEKTLDWRYIIKIIEHNAPENFSYAVYDGAAPTAEDELIDWQLVVWDPDMNEGNGAWKYADALPIKIGVVYDTQLYLAGVEGPMTDGTNLKLPGSVVTVTNDVMISAIWTARSAGDLKITLTHGEGSGSDIVRYVSPGDTYVVPDCTFTAPANKGFLGWKWGSNTKIYQPGDKISNVGVEITLTAQWANIATIHFDAKGQGYSTGGSTDESCIVGSSFLVPNSKFRPNNQSVFFYCWSTDENLERGFYHPGDVISNVAGDFTLYAKWIDVGHTITFKSSTTHDTVATYSLGAGAKGILPDEALIRQLAQGLIVIPQEWKLLGWTTRSISQNVEYLPGDRIVVNSDMNLYAIWTDSITVKNGNDNIGTMPRGSDYTLPYDTVTPPIPNTDWKFMGWSVTINKWNTESWKTIITFTKPVDEDGYIIKNGTIKYVYDTMEEARVITGSTTTYYHSFTEAVDEAVAGSIVELLSDVTLDSTLTIDKKLTLTGDYKIKIKDVVDPLNFPENAFIKIGNEGDLTIIGPTIDANLKYRAIINSQGKLTIRDGLVTGGKVTDGYGPGVFNMGNATFNMTGGEISGNVTEGVNATTYKVYASDLFIGPSTSAQITGGTIGRMFVDANVEAQNPQLTMDGATASVVYIEYGVNSTDQMRLVSGTLGHLYVSTNVCGVYKEVSSSPGLYKGGVVIQLIIHYEYEDHSVAFADHTALLGKGVEYSVQSPVIEGYVPNITIVSGITETSDIVVTVTYSAVQE